MMGRREGGDHPPAEQPAPPPAAVAALHAAMTKRNQNQRPRGPGRAHSRAHTQKLLSLHVLAVLYLFWSFFIKFNE